jgi:RNA polymerase sigma-70 factor (ECF subfamily)
VELSLEELMPDRDDFERLDGRISASPEGAAIRGEQGQRLREAIRSLPPHYRIVLVLRDMEGLTDEEVAEITGLRQGTIRVRLHRARLFVRKELAKLNGSTKNRVARRAHRSVEPPSRTGRCKKIFAELSDYLDGTLDDFSCEELEAHMNGCQPCKKFLRSVANTIKQCRQLPSDRPDPNEAAALRKQILATYSRALAKAGK